MKLKDRVAIITGGGKGIGKAIALAFAAEGASVVVAARNLDRLEETVKQINAMKGKALAVKTDVSDELQVQAMVDKTIKEYGKIDILVNNSGISGPTVPVVDLKLNDWNEVIAIDLTGSMICSKAVLKYMIAAKCGNIINIGSDAGKKGYPMRSPYCVSKWGMIGLTQTVALEAGQYNIRVNCITPGPVKGERLDNVLKGRAGATGKTFDELMAEENARCTLKKIATESEVAAMAVFLASDDSRVVTGQAISLNC